MSGSFSRRQEVLSYRQSRCEGYVRLILNCLLGYCHSFTELFIYLASCGPRQHLYIFNGGQLNLNDKYVDKFLISLWRRAGGRHITIYSTDIVTLTHCSE